MNFERDYFLGLDCGTESVGYAVTDTEYNILKFNGKAMWGSHLFDEALTAEARRAQRCARRRLQRKKERIKITQALFSKEIDKIDPTFFLRLNDSALSLEDRTEKQKNSIFNDENFNDKDFFKKYPTIFHLRKELMYDDTPHDVRLVYLAVSHIMKNRGHFLFPGENLKAALDLSAILDEIKETFRNIYDDELEISNHSIIENALEEKSKGKRKEELAKQIDTQDKKLKTEIIKLFIGNKVKAEKLFYNEEYKDLKDIDFSSSSYDEQILPELEANLESEEFKFVNLAKSIYDWSLLAFVMSGYPTLSEAKVALYNSNKDDLAALKRVCRKCLTKEEYRQFFHADTASSFSNYIGEIKYRNKNIAVKRCTTEEFYKRVKSILTKADNTDPDVIKITQSIENGTFLPLLISFRNGAVPYQIHKMELEQILRNASKYLPFLSEKDETGLTVADKLMKTLTFRVPYFVGPLGKNDNDANTWMVRKENGKILPWNFEDKVDIDSSAEGFIRRMISKCTYLPTEDVIPKNSLLYSKYMVLNDLNNVRINGQKLEIDKKQEIYKELFSVQKKVTQNKLKRFVIRKGWYSKNAELDISGIDGDFKSSLSSFIDFKPYIESGKLKRSDVEEIIKWITLFSDGGNMARNRIEKNFGAVLSKEDINKISRLKYSGWGRFSQKFLAGITTEISGRDEYKSIISLLWESQDNLMEIINKYEFSEPLGNTEKISHLDYSEVDSLYVSPSVKRQIWQTLRIVDEIEKIMGKPPKKVFIEVAREKGDKGQRKESRKNTLLTIMRNKKKELPSDIEDVIHSLESFEESDISKRDKLYLYFTQCGKCMYSGRPIDISDIGTAVDVDHIYPYSQSNDDSLNNKVLVYSEYNREKTNDYPIKADIRIKMASFWNMLKDKELITKTKYERLIRSTPFSDADLNGFIARQLVETTQNTKATAEILKRYFGDNTKVVYSKAGNVTKFRDIFKIYKSRSVNSLHHANDAYLNIVVGNVFDVKYTANFFIHGKAAGYFNLAKPFEYDVPGAWKTGEEGTIKLVKRTLNKNNIIFTRQPVTKKGQLFDLMLVKAGSKQGLLPSKISNPVLQEKLKEGNKEQVFDEWTNKYGGYNSLATAYFALVKHMEKGKPYATFIPISIIDSKELSDDENLLKYCIEKLKMTEPQILYKKLLINTLIKVNGYLLTISGKSNGGAVITLKNSVPLILSNELTNYVKTIDKFLERKQNFKNYTLSKEHDGISEENNIILYEELCRKANQKIYLNRPGCQIEVINTGLDKFIALSVEDQCSVLSNMITYFGMNTGLCNFSLIGGKPKTGTLTISAKVDLSKKKLSIIFQSTTGLFSEEVVIS